MAAWREKRPVVKRKPGPLFWEPVRPTRAETEWDDLARDDDRIRDVEVRWGLAVVDPQIGWTKELL